MKKNRFVVGVAGKPGCGKTTTANILSQMGFEIIDLDREGHICLESEKEKIKNLFGDEAVKNGKIDRKFIADIVFSNPEMLKKLEKILHPKMFEKVVLKISKGGKFVIDGAVIGKIGIDKLCDAIVWVECDKEVAFERVKKSKNWNREEFEQRWNAVPKIKCDVIIENDESEEKLREKITKLLQKLKINH